MCFVLKLGEKFLTAEIEGIRDVLDEDETEDHMFIDGGIERRQQLVCGRPKLLFKIIQKLLGRHHDSMKQVEEQRQ